MQKQSNMVVKPNTKIYGFGSKSTFLSSITTSMGTHKRLVANFVRFLFYLIG